MLLFHKQNSVVTSVKGYKLIKNVITTLALSCCLLIAACSPVNQAGSEEGSAFDYNNSAESGPEEYTMSEVINIHGDDEQDNSLPGSGSGNSASADSEPTQSPPLQVIPLFSSLSEISLESYLLKHGSDSLNSDPLTANATRVAAVELNKSVLDGQNINDSDRLTITAFDKQTYTVSITRTDSNGAFALRGKTTDSSGHFYLSAANGVAYATLEVPAQDAIYLIKCNPALPGYYLFQAPLKNTGAIEDSPPLIPPAAEE